MTPGQPPRSPGSIEVTLSTPGEAQVEKAATSALNKEPAVKALKAFLPDEVTAANLLARLTHEPRLLERVGSRVVGFLKGSLIAGLGTAAGVAVGAYNSDAIFGSIKTVLDAQKI